MDVVDRRLFNNLVKVKASEKVSHSVVYGSVEAWHIIRMPVDDDDEYKRSSGLVINKSVTVKIRQLIGHELYGHLGVVINRQTMLTTWNELERQLWWN